MHTNKTSYQHCIMFFLSPNPFNQERKIFFNENTPYIHWNSQIKLYFLSLEILVSHWKLHLLIKFLRPSLSIPNQLLSHGISTTFSFASVTSVILASLLLALSWLSDFCMSFHIIGLWWNRSETCYNSVILTDVSLHSLFKYIIYVRGTVTCVNTTQRFPFRVTYLYGAQ